MGVDVRLVDAVEDELREALDDVSGRRRHRTHARNVLHEPLHAEAHLHRLGTPNVYAALRVQGWGVNSQFMVPKPLCVWVLVGMRDGPLMRHSQVKRAAHNPRGRLRTAA